MFVDGSWNDRAWKPKIITGEQWLQVELNQVKAVSAIGTQGVLTNGGSSYCQTYTLSHSKGGAIWQTYKDGSSIKASNMGLIFEFNNNILPSLFSSINVSLFILKQIFTGNTNATDIVKNTINPPLNARFIRFYCKSWYSEPALKVEVYGNTTGLKAINVELVNITEFLHSNRKESLNFKIKR